MYTYMVVLYGPTGVGKSDIAERVAYELMMNYQQKAAIVNLDMGQCYVPLTIGTAKPLWRSSTIPHYLFDIIHTPIRFSVVDYRQALLEVLRDLWGQGILPILVGGSGFYLKSLFFPPSNVTDDLTKDAFCAHTESIDSAELWQKLNGVDPERARAIHPNDAYRLRRALTIWHATGQKPSTFTPQYNPIAPTLLICLQRKREDLCDRINKRVLEMIKEGWVEEVKALLGSAWEPFLEEKKIIGYDDIIHYLHHKIPFNEVVDTIQQKTRAYAKRQMTFWRMLQKEIVFHQQFSDIPVDVHEIGLTSMSIDLYIKQLSHNIWQKMSGRKQ